MPRKKNDVFSQGKSAADGWAGETRNVLLDDFGMNLPTETVPLPSRGTVYPKGHPLHMQETVDIKSMTAKEEDILTNRSFIKKKTVITELIRSCLTNPNINPEDMLMGDRNAIMTSLRITGYGADYNVEVDCPSCGERSKQNFDLATLPIKRLSHDPTTNGVNSFEFTLPLCEKKVEFKYLTGKDEKDIADMQDRLRKQGVSTKANTITNRYNNQILSVDGITDKTKLRKFIPAMPARDSLALRKYMDDNEPGITMRSWMECPECEEQSEVRLPLGASFFWPDAE